MTQEVLQQLRGYYLEGYMSKEAQLAGKKAFTEMLGMSPDFAPQAEHQAKRRYAVRFVEGKIKENDLKDIDDSWPDRINFPTLTTPK